MIEVREAPVPVRYGWAFDGNPWAGNFEWTWKHSEETTFSDKVAANNLLGPDSMHVLLNNGQHIIVRAKK